VFVKRGPVGYQASGKKVRRIYLALAWVPGTDGDAMWAAHTEAEFRQRYAERLTRGESDE
jgi:hypothetical protein